MRHDGKWIIFSPVIGRTKVLEALLDLAWSPEGDRDWKHLQAWPENEVVAVAQVTRLAPLLGAIASRPGATNAAQTLLATFHQAHLLTLAANTRLESQLQPILRQLHEAGVAAIVLKGLIYDRFIYPQPGSRATSDIDLLIQGRKRRRAMEVLYDMGYRPRGGSPGFDLASYHEVEFVRNAISVDLHTGFCPLGRASIDLADVWRDAMPVAFGDAKAYRLRDDHAVVYHAFNMARDHFAVPGIHLVDLAHLLTRVDDPAGLTGIAQRWRCHQAFAAALACMARWLPTVPQPECGPLGRAWNQAGAWREHPGLGDRPSRGAEVLVKFASLDHWARAGIVASEFFVRVMWEQVAGRLMRRTPGRRLGLDK